MKSEIEIITADEFASLLRVADLSTFRDSPAVIPAGHKERLVALGYLTDISGRLRITTLGRNRINAGPLPS